MIHQVQSQTKKVTDNCLVWIGFYICDTKLMKPQWLAYPFFVSTDRFLHTECERVRYTYCIDLTKKG